MFDDFRFLDVAGRRSVVPKVARLQKVYPLSEASQDTVASSTGQARLLRSVLPTSFDLFNSFNKSSLQASHLAETDSFRIAVSDYSVGTLSLNKMDFSDAL